MKKSKPEKYLFEEYQKIEHKWSWAIIIGLSLFLVFSGIIIHGLIPDRERQWNYGALETIPGASIYSSMSPTPEGVAPEETNRIPNQITPLPGARPLQKLPPVGYERENE